MIEYRHFYADGHWVPATGPTELTQHSPVSELPIGHLTSCSAADVGHAVAGARRCFPSWATSNLDQRRRALRALHAALARRTDAFVEVLAEELGVPVWVGRTMQLPMPLPNLEMIIDGLDQVVWRE